MNTFVILPLHEYMTQRDPGEHDQWQGYMTVFVVNHGIIKLISIPTALIGLNMKIDVDKPRDWLRQEVKWTLAIHLQLSTQSVLDLHSVHHLLHALPQE